MDKTLFVRLCLLLWWLFSLAEIEAPGVGHVNWHRMTASLTLVAHCLQWPGL